MVHARHNSDSRTAAGVEPLVLLKENRFAHAAANRLLGPIGASSIWLVYLYGPTGTGKSHLVRHFLREGRRKSAQLQVICETATEFLSAVNQAHTRQDRVEFHDRYSQVDLLVLEDLAPLQGRATAQRRLITILDDLKRSGGRALVTAGTRPGQLEKMLPRLIDRFRGGLCVPVELLERPSRLILAKHLAAARQIPLSDHAASVLADEGPGTPREILATLVSLDMGARQGRKDPDASLVRAHLKSSRPSNAVPLSKIATATAEFFKVAVGEIRSASRLKRAILPRQVAMLLARECSGLPGAQIARFFGRKNHTTVVHACRRTRELLLRDPALARDVERVRRSLRRG